jgi:hypothetical protein
MSRVIHHYQQFSSPPPIANVDSGTLGFKLTAVTVAEIGPNPPSFVTYALKLTPSGVDVPIYAEGPGVLSLKLKPSGVESPGNTIDFDICEFSLTPSGSEFKSTIFPMEEVGTEYLRLTPIRVAEGRVFSDSNTEYLRLTPDSEQHYCPQKVEFVGDMDGRWFSQEYGRWQASDTNRWSAEFLGVGEGFAC